MVWVQIVCRNTEAEPSVRKALGSFNLADKMRSMANHLLVELGITDPTAEVLQACREHSFAYLRLVAWEKGGGLERSGEATCVAGAEGQPLKPIAFTIKGERANLEHALFGARNGLVLANVQRRDSCFSVAVTRYKVRGFKVGTPDVLVQEEFVCPPRTWLLDFQSKHIHMDKFVPVIRSALSKVECVYCAHCHYHEIVEDQKKEDAS